MRGISGSGSVKRMSGGVAAVVVAMFVWPFAGALSDAQTSSALRVEVSGAPQRVQGSDGREHIEYDLIITNLFPGEATLKSLEVRADSRHLLSLTGAALGAVTLRVATVPLPPASSSIGPGSTVVTQVDIALPRSAGRNVPRRLTNQIRYAIPANAPLRPLIEATTVDVPAVRVDRPAPVVIAAPLRGPGWANLNGCCKDPRSAHRNTVLPTSRGGYITPEIFAIDWLRIVNGLAHTGDGSKNSDYPTFGAPLYAVANGTVVSTVDNLPDIPPRSENPDLRTPRDFGGNSVFLRIGPGRYACYAHIKRGTVRVRRGQHVRAGQRIGLVGNSGNTTAPHLHFGIQRRPDCLSESEPFEIDRYTLEGNVDPASVFPRIILVGPPRREGRSLPLVGSVGTF